MDGWTDAWMIFRQHRLGPKLEPKRHLNMRFGRSELAPVPVVADGPIFTPKNRVVVWGFVLKMGSIWVLPRMLKNHRVTPSFFQRSG